MSWTIREPWQKEWERYRELLRDANLPLEGVGPGKGGLFLVAVDSAGRVAGGVGLDGMGPELLLRSLVVAPAERGSGLGRALLAAIEEMARDSGAESLFLLTETAARFFAGRGFLDLSREQAPACIRQTAEFAVLCPASARLMVKTLGRERDDKDDTGSIH